MHTRNRMLEQWAAGWRVLVSPECPRQNTDDRGHRDKRVPFIDPLSKAASILVAAFSHSGSVRVGLCLFSMLETEAQGCSNPGWSDPDPGQCSLHPVSAPCLCLETA